MSIGSLESDLIDRAQGGDRAALSQLLLMHYDQLQKHITRRLSSGAAGPLGTDDVLHQTMVRATQSLGGFEVRRGAAFSSWLRTIADNLIRDSQRRRRREKRAADGQAADRNSSWAALVERIAGDATSPSVKTQQHDDARRLRAAVASLPDEYRQVIERYYLLDQSLEEIAGAMGTTKGAVRAICYRARKRLRELMGGSSLYFSD